jgi:hypothetical protein
MIRLFNSKSWVDSINKSDKEVALNPSIMSLLYKQTVNAVKKAIANPWRF